MEIMNVVKRKKKKGFTLIELIAVIAILAILGVILVPKVSGYASRANTSKDLANAKQLLQAVEMYNQDNELAQIGDTAVAPITKVTVTKADLAKYVSWPPNAKTAATVVQMTPFQAGTTAVTTNRAWDTMPVITLRGYAAYLESIAK